MWTERATPGRAGRQRVVDQADVAPGERVRILATRPHLGAHSRVTIAGQRGVVQLDGPAAQRHQVPELGLVDRDEVRVVALDVRVDRGVHARRAEEEVHHVRRGNRHPRDAGGHRVPEEAKLPGRDLARAPERRARVGRREHAPLAGVVAEAERGLPEPEALDRIDEARRPPASPELPVGHGPEAEPLLKGNDLANALVLDGAEPLGGERAAPDLARGREETLRAQEAPDVLGAERPRAGGRHRTGPSSGVPWRSTRFRILPDALFGSSSTSSQARGTL